MIDDALGQLSNLKDYYHKKRVSLLVGSGFSKNACPEFPSWSELLFDMVYEVYKDKIDSAFLRNLSLSPLTKISQEVFAKQEVDRIIYRIGPLELVSQYIARQGFRESIEHYIEERIPYIDSENIEFRFSGKNKERVIPIVPDHLSAHKRLIKGKYWERIYTTNYDKVIEYVASVEDKTLSLITEARNLSVYSDSPTLIKLHGDLHHPDNPRKFHFDGNYHHQYIISAEDYKRYPEDHEAFTQLMRLSLLQGIFCLIGFSGDDPNFINWIEWVRDLLVRAEDHNDQGIAKEYKIYLIGLSENPPSPDKQLFYDNHNIFYIPLLRKDVKEFIGAGPNDDVRTIFCSFFDYLEAENSSKSPENDDPEFEANERKEYLTLWSQVYKSESSGTRQNSVRTLKVDENLLERLLEIKIWNRFVNDHHYQRSYLSRIAHKNKLSAAESQLAVLALKDTSLPVDEKMFTLISRSSLNEEAEHDLQHLVERTATLTQGVSEMSDAEPDCYERILRMMFNLDFAGANHLLKDWKPSGQDVVKKAMLLDFFLQDGAKELLIGYLKRESDVKERFYATRMLNVVERVFPYAHSLARFKNANVQDYADVLNTYIRRVQDEKKKIVRYGDGKNDRVFHIDGKPSKFAEASVVLNFMIDAPYQVSYHNFMNMISPENWYPVHKELFERFPFPIIFYDLQCLDKKVLVRMGQDYAYSDLLAQTCLHQILDNLLKAFLSDHTPDYLKESILHISKELFVSVPSSRWDVLFMKIWDKVFENRINNKEEYINSALDAFIKKGLMSLKSREYRQRVVVDILENVKKDTGFCIDCLYYLQINRVDRNNNVELDNVLSLFISQIDKPEEITVAGNLFRILNEEQKGTVADKCVDLLSKNTDKIMDKVVYHSSLFFVKDCPLKRRAFVESVCSSPLLWHNGLTANGHLGSFDYLRITDYSRRIYFNQDSLQKMYVKMEDSLHELKTLLQKHRYLPFMGDFDGLLLEMQSFLTFHKKRLMNREDYQDNYDLIKELLSVVNGIKNVEEGLFSLHEDNLREALKFIYKNRESFSQEEIIQYIGIIINRVMMKNSDGLDTCISYLRLYLETKMMGNDEQLMRRLVSLLDYYTKDIAQSCNMELVMTVRDMAKIAKILVKHGYSSAGITYWMNLYSSNRFRTNFN